MAVTKKQRPPTILWAAVPPEKGIRLVRYGTAGLWLEYGGVSFTLSPARARELALALGGA